MTIEDEIRAALREDAGEATPPAGGWDDVVARAATHTRRRAIRYPIIGVAAAAAIAAIIAGAVALRTTSESEPPSIATPTSVEPSKVIAAVVDQRLVLLDAETGAELRTLAEGAVVVASVDDEYVYFMRDDGRGCNPATYEIARVPISGGTVEFVIPGINPRVSPDGRWLAYNSNGQEFPRPGTPARCRDESEMVVRDLSTGKERQFSVPDGRENGVSEYALGWSADSKQLLYEIYRGGDEMEDRALLDVDSAGGELKPNENPIAVPDGILNVFGLAPDGSLLVSRSTPDGREIALTDARSGAVKRSIVDVPMDELQPELQPDRHLNVFYAALDPSGRQVLYVTGRADPMPLQRITIGDTAPVALPVTARSAAWVPAGATSPSTTTVPETSPESAPPATATAPPSNARPETFVGVDAEGWLVVVASDDSTRRSGLLPPPTDGSQYETVSVGPGNAIAVSRITPSDNYCSTFETGQIQLVNRETSRTETVGQGRYPALSPDGRRLAWVGVTDCNVVLRVRDLESGLDAELDSLPSDADLSGPIAWALDSRHLMFPVNVEPFRDWWYVDVDSPDSTLTGPAIRQRGEQGGPFAVAFESQMGLVAAVANEDGSQPRLGFLDPQTGKERGSAHVFEDVPEDFRVLELQSDLSGGHLLMIVAAGDERTLYRLDTSRGLVAVASDIRAADW